MFYSCRAFPVSGNNGGHGSPLPAPWPFSVALENRARRATALGNVSFWGKCVSRSPVRPPARNRRRLGRIPDRLSSLLTSRARARWLFFFFFFFFSRDYDRAALFRTSLANDRPAVERALPGETRISSGSPRRSLFARSACSAQPIESIPL